VIEGADLVMILFHSSVNRSVEPAQNHGEKLYACFFGHFRIMGDERLITFKPPGPGDRLDDTVPSAFPTVPAIASSEREIL